jgi:hypothetical protein
LSIQPKTARFLGKHSPLYVRTGKQKPNCTCLSCGTQIFFRGKAGIRRLSEIAHFGIISCIKGIEFEFDAILLMSTLLDFSFGHVSRQPCIVSYLREIGPPPTSVAVMFDKTVVDHIRSSWPVSWRHYHQRWCGRMIPRSGGRPESRNGVDAAFSIARHRIGDRACGARYVVAGNAEGCRDLLQPGKSEQQNAEWITRQEPRVAANSKSQCILIQ